MKASARGSRVQPSGILGPGAAGQRAGAQYPFPAADAAAQPQRVARRPPAQKALPVRCSALGAAAPQLSPEHVGSPPPCWG